MSTARANSQEPKDDRAAGSAAAGAGAGAGAADLEDLLAKTSRTFALNIPLLPEPTRHQVTLAYLLFRIADTFEDATEWPPGRQGAALERFSGLLGEPDPAGARQAAREWVQPAPIDHSGYTELLAAAPAVLARYWALEDTAREQLRRHLRRTVERMAGYVRQVADEGQVRLQSLGELQEYCYAVAGIVGELLTELFLLGRPELREVAGELRRRSRAFGEALQLVNILKDSAFDHAEGRTYLPPEVDRGEVFALARADLRQAAAYCRALQRAGAERGLVAFNALPAALAWAALDAVEVGGPGSKISRPQVIEIATRLEAALDAGEPALRFGAEDKIPAP